MAGWWFFATPLKNDGVSNSWDDDIPNIWENKRCSKPPTRNTVTVHKPTLTTAPTPSPTNTAQ